MDMGVFTSKIYIFLFLAHLAYAFMYMERFNLSIALVDMVGWSNLTKIRIQNGTDSDMLGKFQWDQKHQGMLLSAFFYGYASTQLLGGVLADRCGGKLVCGVGIFLSSLFTLLTPLAAMNSFSLAVVIRVCVGLSQGVALSAFLPLLRNWMSSDGKNQMIAMATAGMEMGAILAFLLGGILCDSTFLGGWPAVFYLFGAMGIVWFIAWMAIVTDAGPQYGELVTEGDERLPLQPSNEQQVQQIKVPWLKILSSTPLWATNIGFFCSDWVWFFITTELPLYYKQVLGIPVMDGGLLSTLPIIVAFLAKTMSGFLSDYLQRRRWSVKTTRKFISMLGFFPTALLLVTASYIKSGENVQAVVFMTLCAGVARFNNIAFLSNMIDLSPTYTGVLMGISSTVAVSSGIGAALVTGLLTNNDPSREKYRIVFFINAAISVFGGVFFSVFLSGDIQEWDPAAETETLYGTFICSSEGTSTIVDV